MIVYAVEEHSGSYEDYSYIINHIYDSKEKAEQYIKIEKERWKKLKEHSDMCNVCELYWNDVERLQELLNEKYRKNVQSLI